MKPFGFGGIDLARCLPGKSGGDEWIECGQGHIGNGIRENQWRAALSLAVDHEGEALESFVTKRRNCKLALKSLRKTMKRHGKVEVFVTHKLRSYGAAMNVIGKADRQETGRWLNNRAENSHQPFRRRERAMLRFRRMRTLQKFASVHASVHNHFNQERHLYNRSNFKLNRATAHAEWRQLCSVYPILLKCGDLLKSRLA